MDKKKTYITQITANDIEEIADAANLHAGEGIEVVKSEDGLEVSIDRQKLEHWIKRVMQGYHI